MSTPSHASHIDVTSMKASLPVDAGVAGGFVDTTEDGDPMVTYPR